MNDKFWDGFQKEAFLHPGIRAALKKTAPQSFLGRAAVIGAGAAALWAMNAEQGGRLSNQAQAEAMGTMAGIAAQNRKDRPFSYLLNPVAAGPGTEIMNRLGRRQAAGAAASPGTTMFPMLSLLRGGDAGTQQLGESNALFGNRY
jgi:hypothetical protein